MCLSSRCPLKVYPSARNNPFHAASDKFPVDVEWRQDLNRNSLAYADDGGPYFGEEASCVVYGKVVSDNLFCQPFGDAIQYTDYLADFGTAHYTITLGPLEDGPDKSHRDCFDEAVENLVIVQNEIAKGRIITDFIRGSPSSWRLQFHCPVMDRSTFLTQRPSICDDQGKAIPAILVNEILEGSVVEVVFNLRHSHKEDAGVDRFAAVFKSITLLDKLLNI